MITLPSHGETLNEDHIAFLQTFSTSCRKSILQMVANAQSGHPGGSLSSIDYLALLYTFILGQTGEKLVVSNGHISPAVYSTLGEMGYVDKNDAVENFRKLGSNFEGHITRHVDGVWFGTGPLGAGVSVGSAFALAEKMKDSGKKSYVVMGDGETQEGQVHEMIHFSKHHKLNNLILFVDYNEVQLTSSLTETLDIDVCKIFEAGNWKVIEVDGHDYAAMWNALSEAQNSDMPVAIIGKTVMGKGSPHMEPEGQNLKPTWHGKPPAHEDIIEDLKLLTLSPEQEAELEEFRQSLTWKPTPANFPALLSKVEINTGTPFTYASDQTTDCRSAYGKALADLAKNNPEVLALVADLQGSVMTKFVAEETPAQHIECGIAEQHMVSVSGGLSLSGYVPFCSTFAAFMGSRAKDQARVNDINQCNVKMVATHAGLSVGEDGPTHQAIDDAGSFLGMFNTMIVEPADPNQTDIMVRYIASHYGNFYMRMGRHKIASITKEDGSLFYGPGYTYEYGKTDTVREGSDVTIVAIGSMVEEAIKAHDMLKEKGISAEVVAATSIQKFDSNLTNSIKKTRKVISVEDHNTYSGLAGQISRHLAKEDISVDSFKMIGVEEYQLSGKAPDLYKKAGIDAEGIVKVATNSK